MRILKLLFILSVFITSSVLANNVDSSFNKRGNYQNKTHLGNPNDASKFLNPNVDTSALQGLNDSSLTNKGNEALRSNPIGKTLQNAEERKIDATEKYKINAQNPYLKNSMQIEENPMSKTGGKGLSATETVSIVKIEKTCTEGVDFNVDVGFELILDCQEIDYLGPLKREPRTVKIHGDVIYQVKHLIYPITWKKNKRYGWHLHQDSAGWRIYLSNHLTIPIENMGEIVRFPYGGRGVGNRTHHVYDTDVVFTYYLFGYDYVWRDKLKKFVENGEYWQVVTEGTEKLADANECEETGRVCLKSGVKTFFDKYEVSRPCWYEKVSYRCRSEPKDGCAHLYRQNCQLRESDCEYQIGGICLKWKRKFICGGKRRELHYSLSNSPIYCLGGDCHTPVLEEDTDFANVAYLAALNESSKDCVKGPNGVCKDPITIFPGQVDGCKNIIAGVINCCSSMKGWGKDINMCRCSGGEKGLAIKREKKLCHSIGTYCHQKEPLSGKCLVKKTNFCCFSSKLARIFHEQGRIQLGIGWGTPSSPNCRPLTLDELTRLDFSKFDMEELFDALLSKGKSNANKQFPHIVPGEIPAKQKEHMSVGPNKDSSSGM